MPSIEQCDGVKHALHINAEKEIPKDDNYAKKSALKEQLNLILN